MTDKEKVLLINADAKFNLAIRKLYRYYKNRTYDIRYLDLELDYYSDKQITEINCRGYNLIYISCIFENSLAKIILCNVSEKAKIDIGGVGTQFFNKRLPDEIEQLEPYYFDEDEISYNFITRGCIRNCYFCKVRPSEGYIRLNKHPKDMIMLKRTEFLDNNILAYPEHLEILYWLVKSQKRIHFNQGLDFRLVTHDNLNLLSKLNYDREYIFAFDDISYMPLIEEKMKLIKTYIPKPYKTKWYVYVNKNMSVQDTVKRVKFLMNNKCLAYIMRDKNCYDKSDESNFYKDLSAYCNQPSFYKKCDLEELLIKRKVPTDRIKKDLEYWNSC